jgi:hypothetical protein
MGFVNQSDVGDLLLKLILCQLPEYKSGRGLTPFWQTNPYNACKHSVGVLILLWPYRECASTLCGQFWLASYFV